MDRSFSESRAVGPVPIYVINIASEPHYGSAESMYNTVVRQSMMVFIQKRNISEDGTPARLLGYIAYLSIIGLI